MAGPVNHQTLRRLVYFAAVAEAGSIRAAARRLRLSVPVVSTAVSELERELELVLATRTTRSFTLTAPGHRVHELARQMMASAHAVQALSAATRSLDGALAITLPNEIATHWLPPRLAIFRKAHPGVALTIDANDRVVTLGDSPFDIAIRVRAVDPAGPRRADALDLMCVAARRAEAVDDGDDIRIAMPLLATGQAEPAIRAVRRRGGASVTVAFDGIITVSNKETARAMALEGLGAVLLLAPSRHEALVPVCEGLDFGQAVFDPVLRDPFPTPEARAFRAICLGGAPP